MRYLYIPPNNLSTPLKAENKYTATASLESRKEPAASSSWFKEEKPEDWPFMEQCEEVLDNIPDTWKAYPDTERGRTDIIVMEYNEFRTAMTPEQKMHELVHLASACLNLWRCLNDK